MRLRLVAGVITFFVAVGVVVSVALLGPSLFASTNSATIASTIPQTTGGNAIVRENAQPGTYNWKIPVGKEASTQIQAYASSTYVSPGKSITFYVSTEVAGTHYSISIYRLGWYGGFGGRSMGLQNAARDLTGQAQGFYSLSAHQLTNCRSCIIDAKTGLVEANWQPSYKLTVPSNWVTGIYLAKFVDANGRQTYAPFDVLGNSSSTYVVVTPDTTYAAYNNWGGSSLYESDNSNTVSPSNGIPNEATGATKGTKVSFDRPYLQETGASQVLVYEADAIHWMERQGYDLSYMSDVNLHNYILDEDRHNVPNQLLQHKAYISLGHDEYWTKEMRDGVEEARDKGVGLAFLGANAAYWQMRFESDSAGVKNRTIVCYKVETWKNDLSRDPLYGHDNSRVTSLWRDPVLHRPENTLIGIMFSDLTHKLSGFAWQASNAASSSLHNSSPLSSILLSGTGLQARQQYGCGLVGYEWDRTFPDAVTPDGLQVSKTPNGLQVLGASHTMNDTGKSDSGNTTYYIAPSGAMVFASGSIFWASALDTYRAHFDETCAGQNTAIPGVQVLMAHVMNELVVHHSQSN